MDEINVARFGEVLKGSKGKLIRKKERICSFREESRESRCVVARYFGEVSKIESNDLLDTRTIDYQYIKYFM